MSKSEPAGSQKSHNRAFPEILGKGLGHNLVKMIDLTTQLGEINDIKHNKGSKICSQIKFFRLYNANHTT